MYSPRPSSHAHSAILFLAPLSGFDQVLAEDATVNRLEDSVLLWKSICSNALLGKTNLILFLNKIDIFAAKLRAGIRFGQYIISYGARPNDYDSTSACECPASVCLSTECLRTRGMGLWGVPGRAALPPSVGSPTHRSP